MAGYVQSELNSVNKSDEYVFFDGTDCEFSGNKEDVERVAFGIVLNKLKECPIFCGKYDAAHGNEHYMYGISTVMETIAHYAGDDEFAQMFLHNMLMSEDKVSNNY